MCVTFYIGVRKMSVLRVQSVDTAYKGVTRQLNTGSKRIQFPNQSLLSRSKSLKDYGCPSPSEMEGANNISLERTAVGLATGTATGAAVGAVVGSVVPVVGTALGAWIGGIFGSAVGSTAGALSTPSKKK